MINFAYGHKKTVLHHLHIKYIFEKLCICSHLLKKFLTPKTLWG